MSASQIYKLFQLVYTSRKHLLEMVEDRGYDVSNLKNYISLYNYNAYYSYSTCCKCCC